jgi:hypothetical protein
MELRGDLQSFPLAQLIQTLDNAQRSGKLDIQGHLGEFAVFFQNGKVIHALSPYTSGLPAFYDAFLEHDGTFNFMSNVIMPPRKITTSTTSLLIEATRLMDEMDRSGSIVDPSALVVATARVFSDEPVALTSDEFIVLQNTGEPKTFDRILRETEVGFFRASAALGGLVDKKIITLSKLEA